MNYWKLRYDVKGKQACRRVSDNLKRLRKMLADTIPTQTTDKNLILGTWNIRNFDDNRFGHGPRLTESLFYLAEIINAFDVIAIQEVCDDIGPLKDLMDILGKDHEFIFTDMTEGRGGNKERLGFIYNKRKVYFKGIAGEIVLPDKLLISAKNKRLQFSRTPFSVEFQSGWFKFTFATVHIYYGKSSKKSKEYKQRVDEIQTIANFLAKRADKESEKYGVNYVLVGDFNIDALGDKAYNALEEAGFEVYQNRTGSNKNKTKFYDQISFKERPGEVVLSPVADEKEQHGVFNAFDVVFRDDDFKSYDKDVINKLNENKNNLKNILAETTSNTKRKTLKKKIASLDSLLNSEAEREKYYLKEWRTFQISDHLPLWIDLQKDFTDKYLDRIINE